jgi:methylated-DNA-[protein]-cysteine S-methyltransferase
MIFTVVPSPVGELLLAGDGEALRFLFMGRDHRHAPAVGEAWRRDDDAYGPARAQLVEYFAGERTAFDLVLEPCGTSWQQRVWAALREIPYGETRSYGELAAAVGAPGSARAVGHANGRNPVSIVVPCHRVVGADGRLTGYGGGLERKRALLAHEEAHVGRSLFA